MDTRSDTRYVLTKLDTEPRAIMRPSLTHGRLGEMGVVARSNVIVGLGPTGLAIALEACMHDSKHRKVIALTDRPDYSRKAIFRLDVDIFPYLEELVGKEKIKNYFDRKLIGPKQSLNGWDFHVIQIKTFEEMLFETLAEQKNVEIIQLPKRGPSQISEIDPASHTIKLSLKVGGEGKEEEKGEVKVFVERLINFKYLIGADGPSHGVRNRIKHCDIEYHPTQQEQLYDRHARVTYKLPKDHCSDHFRLLVQRGIAESKKDAVPLLKTMGWTLCSEPELRLFTIDDYLFVAAECPHTLSPADEAAIDRWIRTILQRICPDAVVAQLEKVDTAVFTVDLEEANRTFVPFLAPGPCVDDATAHQLAAYFFQMGDALRKTHYQTGSGAVVGLREAKAFGEFLRSEQTLENLLDYHAKVAVIRAENRVRVDTFIDGRINRERQEAQPVTAAARLSL